MATNITLNIQGIECPNCVLKLESLEEKMPGVIRAEGNYRKSLLKLEYDPAQLDLTRIQAGVEKLGYTVLAVQ